MDIKDSIKAFFLSFFNDKHARNASKLGFAAVLISLLLAFLFYLFGYFAADVVPFATHYDNANAYKAFVSNAFEGFETEITGGKAQANKKINTYASETDKAAFSVNGYDLIVDTRPSTTLIEFTQSAKKGDKKIDYAQYKALPKTEQKEYEISHEFTDKELELTDELEGRITEYLESISVENTDAYDADGAQDYAALKAKKDEYSQNDYRKELWYLYVKYYYTSARSILASAKAPTLRDYYYLNYVASDKAHYLFVFDDMLAGSFETDGKIPMVFGGYFLDVPDGKATDAHELIKRTYYDTVGNTFLTYFVSAVSQLPMLILIPIALGLIVWGIGKAVKNGWDKTFGGCYKTVSAFVWFAALTVALITFVCSFFASARTMYNIMPILFGAILIIRTAVFCITTTVHNRKATASETRQDKQINDIFGDLT